MMDWDGLGICLKLIATWKTGVRLKSRSGEISETRTSNGAACQVNLVEQLPNTGITLQVYTYWQGVDEQSHQAIQFGDCPIGKRAPHDNILLPGVAHQQDCIRGHEEVEGGQTFLLAKFPDPGRNGRLNTKMKTRTVIRL